MHAYSFFIELTTARVKGDEVVDIVESRRSATRDRELMKGCNYPQRMTLRNSICIRKKIMAEGLRPYRKPQVIREGIACATQIATTPATSCR